MCQDKLSRGIRILVLLFLASTATSHLEAANTIDVRVIGELSNPGTFTLRKGISLKAFLKQAQENAALHKKGRIKASDKKPVLGEFSSVVFLIRSNQDLIKSGAKLKAFMDGKSDYVLEDGDTIRLMPLCFW